MMPLLMPLPLLPLWCNKVLIASFGREVVS